MNSREVNTRLFAVIDYACRGRLVLLPSLRASKGLSVAEMQHRVRTFCDRLSRALPSVSCFFAREDGGGEWHYHGVVVAAVGTEDDLKEMIGSEWFRAFPALDRALEEHWVNTQAPDPTRGGVRKWVTWYCTQEIASPAAVEDRVIATGRLADLSRLLRLRWERRCEYCYNPLPLKGRSDRRFCGPRSRCRMRHLRLRRLWERYGVPLQGSGARVSCA